MGARLRGRREPRERGQGGAGRRRRVRRARRAGGRSRRRRPDASARGVLGGGCSARWARAGWRAAYNLARGSDATTVRWSDEFLDGLVAAALLRYLAVAHFGRGRGDCVAGEYPAHWGALVDAAVAVRTAPALDARLVRCCRGRGCRPSHRVAAAAAARGRSRPTCSSGCTRRAT
ncbi:MAG: hypothetical protein MZV70_33740 [Desulfobacterales bacterium]|nr:hypothetical protein [Desulfobacterales bacterium]